MAYDSQALTCVTCGHVNKMTWSLWQPYCDKAYAILSPDWINSKNLAPNNFDLTTRRSDLQQVVSAPGAAIRSHN